MDTIFYWIAIPSTAIFLFLTFSSFLGFGDSDLDMDDVDGDFPILTIKNLFTFLTMFSWTGMICSDYNYSIFKTLTISTISGTLLVLATYLIYYMVDKLKQKTDSSLESTIDKIGTVYLKVSKGKIGQVNILINGSLQTVDATSVCEETFDNGENVRIVGVIGTSVIIDKLSK